MINQNMITLEENQKEKIVTKKWYNARLGFEDNKLKIWYGEDFANFKLVFEFPVEIEDAEKGKFGLYSYRTPVGFSTIAIRPLADLVQDEE